MADDNWESRFRVPFEAFSVVTATVFVVSAVTNAAIFGLVWRLNYFLIATPADVVMSGFIATIWAGAILLLIAFVVFSVWGFWHRSAYFAEVFSGGFRFSGRRARPGRVAMFRAAVLFVGLLSGVLGAVGANILWVVTGAEAKRVDPFTYPTGLKAAPEAEVPAQCEGGRVLWSGSSAAVLECTDNIRVLHNLEGFVTEPIRRKPRPPKSMPPPKIAPPPTKKGGVAPPLPNPAKP